MANNNELVTVIVPVYNSELYLEACIESLVSQTYSPIEILLIDDGSLDLSGSICEGYANRYNNIKVHHKVNGGTSDAKNFGIIKSTGKWILFVDSDDYVESSFVDTLIKPLEEFSLDIVVCGYQIDYIKDQYTVNAEVPFSKKYYLNEGIQNAIYDLDCYGLLNVAVCKTYRRENLINNQIFFEINLTTGEDLVFNCKYFKHINSLGVIRELPYHYVRRDEISLVSKYRENLSDMVKVCNNARYDLYNFYDMKSVKYKVMYGKTYIEYIAATIPNMYRNNSKLNSTDRERFIHQIINDDYLQDYIKLSFDKLKGLNKLFAILCRLQNEYIFNIVYSTLFIVRNNFSNIYKSIRKIIFTQEVYKKAD